MALFVNRETERTEEIRQNRKLEAVAFLRNSHAQNRQRLSQVRAILYGEPYVPEPDSRDGNYLQPPAGKPYEKYADRYVDKYSMTEGREDEIAGNKDEERDFWISFWRRCIICGAVIALLITGNSSQGTFMDKYKKEIKSVISQDYTEKLFDFIQQIPYTFDYEKINVEG